jgi:SulP family sulfate permease
MNDALPTKLALADERKAPDEKPAAETKHGAAELFFRLVPAFDSLRHYSLAALQRDTVAGLTVAAMAVPQAMAYAHLAGVPPEYGLYTAIVMTTVGALFDSSKQLINGPTNVICIALLSALAPFGALEDKIAAAVLLGLMIGCIQTGITLLRLGDLTRYVSHAVIVGFTLGAGILLALDQLKNLVGLVPHGEPHDHFFKRFWLTLSQGEIHGPTLTLGLGAIALVLAFRALNAWLKRRTLPEFLLALIISAGVVWLFGLEARGVAVIGEIPRQLPSFQVPAIDWAWVRELAGSALAIALLGLLEALAMAKAIAAQTGQKLDMNQQCLSEGLANLTGSFFQCLPGSGSLTRSAVNQQTGAVSQWSGVISAAAVAATVLLFAPLARYIPRAALAGILLVSAWYMIDRRQLVYHLRATRFDMTIVLVTAAAALFISVEFCILTGIFLSFVLYVPRAAEIHLTELTLAPERVIRERRPDDPRCSRILLCNLEGEFFFGASPDLEQHLEGIAARAKNGVRVIVLRLKRARNLDAVCVTLLDEFLERMAERNVTVLLCGVRRDLARVLRSTGLEARLGRERIFHETVEVGSSTLAAVRRAYELIGGDLCDTCPQRAGPPNAKESWYYMI